MRATPVRILIAIAACILGGTIAWSAPIDDWVQRNLDEKEKVLCKGELNGDYFFVTRAGDRVKLGSRLDLTGYAQPGLVIGWTFLDEADRSLSVRVRPTPVKKNYVRDGGKAFAESVEYQTVKTAGSRSMRVSVDVKKCPSPDCDRRQKRSEDENEYTFNLCEVQLDQ